MVDLLERLEVLLDLECDSYRTVDYLASKHLECMDPTTFALDLCDLESAFASSSSSSETGVNEVWREKICEWSYQVIDHFDFSREVVSVAIHYLDRFLAKVQVNKKLFQLVAMTSLYMAIKIYEPGTLCMSSMIELSRGCFSPAQMAEMEMALLRTLQWRMHPPTAYCFCKHILFLLPQSHLSMDDRHEILELARFLTELSVIDFYFVVHRPSDVALAALLNSIEAVTGGSSESASMVFQTELRRVRGFSDPSKPEVSDCRNRLQILYSRGGYSRPEARESRDETVPSPVSVAFGVHLPEVLSSKEHCENHDELDAPGNLDDIGIDDTDSHIDMAGWIWIRRPSAKQRPQ